MPPSILPYIVALVIQSLVIYGIGEIRRGIFLVIQDSEKPQPYQIIHRGISTLYYLAWLGLVISVLGALAVVSANIEHQQRMQRWQSERNDSPPGLYVTPGK